MSKTKIKILHIIPVFATGGAERLVLQYAQLLDHTKFEIHVASCVEDGPLRSTFDDTKDIHVFVGSREKDGGRRAVYKKLETYAVSLKPDVVHTHMLSADFFGYKLKKKLGKHIRWVSTMHNVETATSFLRQVLWKYILKKADRVIAVSENVARFTRKTFHVSDKKLITIKNGVVIDVWKDLPIKKLLKTKNHVLQIASVGRLWEQKGHVYLLRALSLLQEKYTLHLFGDGPLKKSLQQEAKKLGIFDHVKWHGVVSDVPKNISNMDIIVQPSLWEGLSLVVMEMMAAGKPVVTTPAGGDELIQHKKTGYIVPFRDPQALADAITYINAHPNEVNMLTTDARLYALHHFDIQQNIQSVTELYQTLYT